MFLRATSFKIDSAQEPAFWEEAEAVAKKLKAIPGITHQFTGLQDDGNAVSIAVWESEAAAKAGNDKVQAIWTSLGNYLRTPPKPTGYVKARQLV